MFNGLSLLLYCRELLSKVLDSVVEQANLGDESVKKVYFVSVSHLDQVESEMMLLKHQGGHHLSEGQCLDFSRCAQLLHRPRVSTTLVHLFECLGLVNL